MNSLQDVRDSLVELLIYLDKEDQEGNEAVLGRFRDLRGRLGDDCTLLRAYIYSILTRKDIWDKLGGLWEALYKHSQEMRKHGQG